MKIIIFGAGKIGKDAYHYFGMENVFAFGDNNKDKIGKYFCNKPILSAEQIVHSDDDYHVVIATLMFDEISRQFSEMGFNRFTVYKRDYPVGRDKFKSVLVNCDLLSYSSIALAGINPYTKMVAQYMEEAGIGDRIKYFIQGEEGKRYDHFLGKNVHTVASLPDDTDAVIVTEQTRNTEQICMDIRRLNIKVVDLFGSSFVSNYTERKSLIRFKDTHIGERCFILGNGPSLRIEDLDILHEQGMYCFASNKIYKAFGMTKWRPSCLVYIDMLSLSDNMDDVEKLKLETKLVADFTVKDIKEYGNILYRDEPYDMELFLLGNKFDKDGYPDFSEEPARVVYEGFTVTYAMLQWAAYMGFKEIYLLGVDHKYNVSNYTGEYMKDYKLRDHFLENYLREGEKVHIPRLDRSTKAYEKAEKYSREKGIRIYNATRGGALEVFERVNFDDLFTTEKH